MWKKRGDISHCIRQISCLLTKLGLTKLQMWLFNLRVKFGRGLSKHSKFISATQVGENSLHFILYGKKHDSLLVILLSLVLYHSFSKFRFSITHSDKLTCNALVTGLAVPGTDGTSTTRHWTGTARLEPPVWSAHKIQV